MDNKLLLVSAASVFSVAGIAANYTNFIIINLDDAGYGDFSYNGAYGYTTPNIDQMAAEGVRFTHFLAGQPISGASRAGLLTGCYPNRIGFAGAPGPDSNYGIHPDEMTDQTRLTTDYTTHSVDFIKRNKNKPFFLYLAHNMPHVPLAVSDKFKGKSQQGLYGDVMMEIDWSVGEVMKTLRELGLEENTLVILTSDNGPWTNYGNHAGSAGGLREAKATTFDGGNRVPCLMYWKGKTQPGTTCNNLASNIDLFPTFAEISGAPLPDRKIDGVSILSLIRGEKDANPRESFVYYYNKNDLEAVTDGMFKLVFPHKYVTYGAYVPGNDGQPGKLTNLEIQKAELYDLRRDPGERYDVISQYPEVAAKLMKIADLKRQELGDNLTRVKGTERREPGLVQGKERHDL